MIARHGALQLERERQLLEAYAHASDESRALLEDILRAGLDPSRSRRLSLPLETIARATRAARSSVADVGLDLMTGLVDSLGIQVVPGVFAAREEGLGEPITVTLASLWRGERVPEPEGGIEVLLYWVASDGSRLLARRETASAKALQQGFEIYIRPPVSKADLWSLELELRCSRGVVRGVPVAVECVEDLAGLRRRLDRLLVAGPEPLALVLATRLRNLGLHGLRRGSVVRLSDWVEFLDHPGHGASILPVDCGDLDTSGTVVWEQREGRGSATKAVLLLAGPLESPVDLLSGPVGAGWARFARENSYRVIAASSAMPGHPGFQLCDLARHLELQQGVEELVVVARGDFGRSLPASLTSEACKAIEALVLAETWAARARLPRALSLPTLQIEFNADEAGSFEEAGDGEARRSRVRLREPHPLTALRTPELLGTWLRTR